MKILVSGSSGLLGTNLVKRLSKNHKVFCMSRNDGFDLLDKAKTSMYIKRIKPEIVYHLAANAAESRGQVSPVDMTERNLNIFLHVLVPAINVGVKRFIYTSSVAVYGDCELPYREDDLCKPKDVYGVNKLACEQILKIMAKLHNFEFCIFRPHNIYGEHQDMSNPYKNVVALFMRNIMEDRELTMFGGGKMKRAFSYVHDVVDVLEASLADRFRNQTVNVGSDIDVDLHHLLEMIEKIAGKKAVIRHLPAREQEIYLFLASHRKLNLLYDYKETPLYEGLKKTWDFINLPNIVRENNEIQKR